MGKGRRRGSREGGGWEGVLQRVQEKGKVEGGGQNKKGEGGDGKPYTVSVDDVKRATIVYLFTLPFTLLSIKVQDRKSMNIKLKKEPNKTKRERERLQSCIFS